MPNVLNKIKNYGVRAFTSLCSIVFLCALPNIALAEVREYALFSIDIPKGWTIKEEVKTYIFMEPKEQCVINLTAATHQGASYNELGILLYQNLQGMKPKSDDDGFTFLVDTKSEIVSTARLTYQGDNFVLMVASGACKNFQDIVSSLTMKNKGPRPYPILAPEQTLK